MCGIVGYSGPEGRGMPPITKMLERIQHRGPDDQGIYENPSAGVSLGHARLSIIDLSSAGHQPMWDHSHRFVMVFNGEIYNFQELRKYLEQTYDFHAWRSTSDSEVIINGFSFEGGRFLDRLNGIYGIAIFDTWNCQLTLCRDPFGIKPLYCYEKSGNLYFASELKAFLALDHMDRSLNHSAIGDLLAFMYVPEPATLFQHVRKLAPGTIEVYHQGSLIHSRAIQLSDFLPDTQLLASLKEEDWINAFRQQLTQAVDRQMIADVPVGAFLSGGVDSSAIVGLAHHHGNPLKKAFTIAFSQDDLRYDQSTDDLAFAKQIAKKFQIDLEVVTASTQMLDDLEKTVYHLDDGLTDPAAINTSMIVELARKAGIKVLLSGQGADELLGGYRRHQAERLYSRIPLVLRWCAGKGAGLVPASVPGRFNALARRSKKLLKHMGQTPEQRLVQIAMWDSPQHLNSLLKNPHPLGNRHRQVLSQSPSSNGLERSLHLDRSLYLTSHNLMYTDKMSMRHGVEVRVPFLDHTLASFCLSVPESLKIRGWQQKYILKQAMTGLLPDTVLHRSKSGFGSPIRTWLRKPPELFYHYLSPQKLENQGLFNKEAVIQSVRSHKAGEADYAYPLFALLNFQIWHEQFIGS